MIRKTSTLSLSLLGLGLLLSVAAGCTLRDAVASDAETIYASLMCKCGCNQVLGVCNMLNCPSAVPLRAEVDGYLADGRSAGEILAIFVDKYGQNILSAPPTSGWFNVSGWVMPFLALVAGLGALAFYLRRFRERRIETAADSPAAEGTLDRLESELADFNPRD